MNDQRLRIYLSDHVALMVGEIALAKRCHASNRNGPLGEFLSRLVVQIENQRAVAGDVLKRIGGSESTVKNAATVLAERLGRFKLNDSLLTYSPLSRVVELEALAAAAQERVSLWDTLDAVGSGDGRLEGITFSVFRDEADAHLREMNTRRRFAAAEAFSQG
jgi:hypothetical protein